ncbi:hypothetical protein [Alienimonas chondri]|uniref:Uncharacterized protein n=1 Tax=Alienimonas chondri TaxID=2681879 RepID=A0ABX1VFP8_9PLAN|nr:hypothetical protein [Alienimonas chondri]NNJ26922.1 hypothetical protein [Alienimonas chondri]
MVDDEYRFASGWAEPSATPTDPSPASNDSPPTEGGGSRRNLLLDAEPVEYAIERTRLGVWRRHLGEDGKSFSEFTSHGSLGRLPWVHMTFGKDPATRRRKTAKGVFALGRWAVGVVAVGQVSAGVVAVGQAGFGLLFGLGQLTTGAVCIGQFAVGAVLALGQFAVADVAIGQIACGRIAIGQLGFGGAVWDMRGVDPAARAWAKQTLGI